MNIDDAAAATGCYFITRVDFNDFFVGTQDTHAGSFKTYADARAACDRMNLRAVLEAIRDTSLDSHRRAVLDAIIEEVGK